MGSSSAVKSVSDHTTRGPHGEPAAPSRFVPSRRYDAQNMTGGIVRGRSLPMVRPPGLENQNRPTRRVPATPREGPRRAARFVRDIGRTRVIRARKQGEIAKKTHVLGHAKKKSLASRVWARQRIRPLSNWQPSRADLPTAQLEIINPARDRSARASGPAKHPQRPSFAAMAARSHMWHETDLACCGSPESHPGHCRRPPRTTGQASPMSEGAVDVRARRSHGRHDAARATSCRPHFDVQLGSETPTLGTSSAEIDARHLRTHSGSKHDWMLSRRLRCRVGFGGWSRR